jgi:hypothetical protein
VAFEERAMIMERARAGAIEEVLVAHGPWEERFAVCLTDIERMSLIFARLTLAVHADRPHASLAEITHGLMDLFVACVPLSSWSSNGAPVPPSTTPIAALVGEDGDDTGASFSTTCVQLLSLDRRGGAELTAVKIELRRREAARVEAGGSRPDGQEATTPHNLARREARERGEGVGRNEGTVRFLFS